MKAYWDSLTKEQQGELAGKVGSTPGYLHHRLPVVGGQSLP